MEPITTGTAVGLAAAVKGAAAAITAVGAALFALRLMKGLTRTRTALIGLALCRTAKSSSCC